MKSWWISLTPRERLLCVCTLVLFMIYVAIAWIAYPLYAANRELQQQYKQRSELVHWMRPIVARIREAKQTKLNNNANVLSVVESSIKTSLIASDVAQLGAGADGRVRLQFDAVSFDTLIHWLQTLQLQHAIVPHAMTVRRLPEAGQVQADIQLM